MGEEEEKGGGQSLVLVGVGGRDVLDYCSGAEGTETLLGEFEEGVDSAPGWDGGGELVGQEVGV